VKPNGESGKAATSGGRVAVTGARSRRRPPRRAGGDPSSAARRGTQGGRRHPPGRPHGGPPARATRRGRRATPRPGAPLEQPIGGRRRASGGGGDGCSAFWRSSQLATPPTERDSVRVAVAEQAPNRGHSVPALFGAELCISWSRPKRAGQARQARWHTVKRGMPWYDLFRLMRFRIQSPRPGRQVHGLCGAVASCLPLQGCAYPMRLKCVDTCQQCAQRTYSLPGRQKHSTDMRRSVQQSKLNTCRREQQVQVSVQTVRAAVKEKTVARGERGHGL